VNYFYCFDFLIIYFKLTFDFVIFFLSFFFKSALKSQFGKLIYCLIKHTHNLQAKHFMKLCFCLKSNKMCQNVKKC